MKIAALLGKQERECRRKRECRKRERRESRFICLKVLSVPAILPAQQTMAEKERNGERERERERVSY